MEYRFSVPVDEEKLHSSGAFTTLPVRVHRQQHLAIAGSDTIEHDWTKAFGQPPASQACRSSYGHLAALSLPECLPDRLHMCAYIMDYMLHHDDVADLNTSEAKREHADLAVALNPRTFEKPQGPLVIQVAKKGFQAQMMAALMRVDKADAVALLGEWSNYAKTSANTTDMIFHSFEEYLKHRYHEAAIPLYFEIQCFATGLRLNGAELREISHIITPLGMSMALVNDYFSFDKEFDQFARTSGTGQMYNAVAFLVKEKSLPVHSAKAMLKDNIISLENEFKGAWKSWLKVPGGRPAHIQKYLEYAALTAAGSSFWHAKAPRYEIKDPLASSANAAILLQTRLPERALVDEDGEKPLIEPQLPNGTGLIVSTCAETGPAGLESRKRPLHDPLEYMASLPSKNVRNMVADAFNVWLQVSDERLTVIKEIVSLLHHASLILDDIEDGSMLRRGKPAAHVVYGAPQAINTASYVIVRAMGLVQHELKPETAMAYTEQVAKLHLGQSWDIEWRESGRCPSESEYFQMIDLKTGALFQLLVKMMQAESPTSRNIDFGPFVALFGRYFQVRDDYQNLTSAEYAEQKGFCEDLEEGKFSLPVIYTLQGSELACKIMQRRGGKACFTLECKKLMLEEMEMCKSLQRTRAVLQRMEHEMLHTMAALEAQSGIHNPFLAVLMERLKL